jgi:hypothetical protein
MYGESSEFGPIDLLAGLAVNIGGTHMACKSPTLRVGMKNKAGDIPAYADFRFLGGAVAALAAQWVDSPNVRRAAHDVANGLLNSYVATETARRAAIANLDGGAAGVGDQIDPATGRMFAAPAQDTTTLPPAAAPAGEKVGGGNYNYGW